VGPSTSVNCIPVESSYEVPVPRTELLVDCFGTIECAERVGFGSFQGPVHLVDRVDVL
jgi:hypothetical protein